MTDEIDGNALFDSTPTQADEALSRDSVADNTPEPAPGAEDVTAEREEAQTAAQTPDPSDAPENIPSSDTPEGQQTAAGSTTPPAGVSTESAPPQWLAPLIQGFQSQMQPLAEQNRQLAEIVAQERQTRQNFVTQQQRQRQAALEKQALEASRPRPPDWNIATPEDVAKYAEQLADWKQDYSKRQLQHAVDSRFENIERAYKEMAAREQQRVQQEQLVVAERAIVTEVDGLKAKPEFAFLKNKEAEDGFYRYWYSLNEQSGQPVTASDAAKSLLQLSRLALQNAQVAQNKSATAQLTAERRSDQKAMGTPPPVRGTASTAGVKQNDIEAPVSWWNDKGITGTA